MSVIELSWTAKNYCCKKCFPPGSWHQWQPHDLSSRTPRANPRRESLLEASGSLEDRPWQTCAKVLSQTCLRWFHLQNLSTFGASKLETSWTRDNSSWILLLWDRQGGWLRKPLCPDPDKLFQSPLLQRVELFSTWVHVNYRWRNESESLENVVTCSVSCSSFTLCMFFRKVRYRCLYSDLINNRDNAMTMTMAMMTLQCPSPCWTMWGLSPVVVGLVVSLHKTVEGCEAVKVQSSFFSRLFHLWGQAWREQQEREQLLDDKSHLGWDNSHHSIIVDGRDPFARVPI